MSFRTVTIIGANGTMGSNISAIFGSFGNVKVYMVSRSLEHSIKAVDRAVNSVKADSIKKNLIPVDYSKLGDCIIESDWVIESVIEDYDTKLELNREVAKWVDEETIISTNTSGFSINKLAMAFPENIRRNYMGVHFYNPPYNLILCELVPSEYTDLDTFNRVKNYVTNTLYRTAVEVKDTPAFMGNRIGFQFINEALQYAEMYSDSGGIDYIDSILGQFTGRSMAPLITSDFVGLDVHKAIVDNIYQNTSDYAKNTFIMPQFAMDLISEGKLGRKTKCGLYKREVSEGGIKRDLVYDIASSSYRDKIKFSFPFAEKMISSFRVGDYKPAFHTLINNSSIEAMLCLELLLKYVIYSLETINHVGYNKHSADDVMAAGFNWCPPLAVIEALYGVDYFKSLVLERLSNELLEQVDLESLLHNLEPSKYDFRRYFKAMH